MRRGYAIGMASLAFMLSGCVKSMMINGQIDATRQASTAFDELEDFELAERAASAALVQFEGMHTLAPDNRDALFLLTKGWTGYGYGFVEDAMEIAEEDGRRDDAEYHKKRAISAYTRAINAGVELLSKRAHGFVDAKKDEGSMSAWLEKYFTTPDDAANLFWTGYAWLARANLSKDDAVAIAELFVGVEMIERSVAVDPAYYGYAGTALLGAYHARSAMAELDVAEKHFDQAVERTARKNLIVLFNYATRYACARADNVLYTKLLNEVLQSEEDQPSMRLTNAIARRRAKRWLGEKRMFDACGIDPVPPSEPAPAEGAAG